MPRLTVNKMNNYYTEFKIQPSKRLAEDYDDWGKRIQSSVTGLKIGDDYETKFHVQSRLFFIF